MSRTQDLVVARLRMLAARWTGQGAGAAAAWAHPTAASSEPDQAAEALPGGPSRGAATGPGLRVILALSAVALVVGGWMLVRSWPRAPEGMVGSAGAAVDLAAAWPAGVSPSEDAAPGLAGLGDPFSVPAASPSASPSLVVHVAGEVRNPGVVVLPPGSRVGDAVAAAGGLRRGGSLGPANLARVLADGERIEIGENAPAAEQVSVPGAGPGATGASIDLNSATAEQLDALPGIGPITAAKILAWRAEHGRFSVIDELAEVPGIGPRTLEELRPHVRI